MSKPHGRSIRERIDSFNVSNIQKATTVCLKAFEDCRKFHESSWLIARQADFRLWVASTRADQPIKRSLDTKLELAGQKDAQQVIIRLLVRLRGLVDSYGEPNLHERTTSATTLDVPANSDSSSDESDIPILTPAQTVELGVDRIIDQLARIAVVIRRAGNRSRLRIADKKFDATQHKALREHLTLILLQQQARVERDSRRQLNPEWRTQNRDRLDRDAPENMNTIEPSALEYTFNASGSMPKLTEMQERLVEVNLRRRNRFLQARHQRQPKAVRMEIPVPTVAAPEIRPVPSVEPVARPAERSQKSIPIRAVPSIDKQSTTMSEISTLPQLAPVVETSQIAPTQITTTANKVSFPYPPKIKEDAKTFQCPSCCQVLGVDVAQERDRWKKHVISDVLPYSCVLPGCDTPFETFLNKQEWKSHLLDRHRAGTRWTCSICGEKYGAEANFRSHVVQTHSDTIDHETLSLMVDTCREQALDLEACPLCQWPVEGSVELQELLDHVAQEMHDFALRSLPTTAESQAPTQRHAQSVDILFHRPSDSMAPAGDIPDALTFVHLKRHEAAMRLATTEKLVQRIQTDTSVDSDISIEELPDPHYKDHAYFEESDPEDDHSSAGNRSSMDSQFSSVSSDTEAWAANPTPEYGDGPLRLLSRGDEPNHYRFDKFTLDGAPPCCFLSHDGGQPKELVRYGDLRKGEYEQTQTDEVEFALEKAAMNGCAYVFIYACCVDHLSSADREQYFQSSETILQQCATCLVHLPDVTDRTNLGRARWFTECWTIQDLVVPSRVQFYTREGNFLGGKDELQNEIKAICGIDVGKTVAETSFAESFAWPRYRYAKWNIDKVYCLLGLLDIRLQWLHDESLWSAQRRLIEAIRVKHGDEVASTLEPWAEYDLEALRLLYNAFIASLKEAVHPSVARVQGIGVSWRKARPSLRDVVKRIIYLQRVMKTEQVESFSGSQTSTSIGVYNVGLLFIIIRRFKAKVALARPKLKTHATFADVANVIVHQHKLRRSTSASLAKVSRFIIALQRIRDRPAVTWGSERQALLGIFNSPGYYPRRWSIEVPKDTSLTWIHEHQEFQQWTRGEYDILWVKGIPGSGKTTLMKYLSDSTQGATVISYFFKGNSASGSSPEAMLRCLLYELCLKLSFPQQLPESLTLLLEMRAHEISIEQLAEAFQHLVNIYRGKVYCFVDAFDKCNEAQAQWAYNLLEVLALEVPRFLLCLSARSYPTLARLDHHSTSVLQLERQPGHVASIRDYVKAHLIFVAEEEERTQAVEKMVQAAEGCFAWIRSTLPTIIEEIKHYSIMSVGLLEELTPAMARLWSGVINTNSNGLPLQRALQWLIYANDTLDNDRFQSLVLASLKMHGSDTATLEVMEPTRFVSFVSQGLAHVTEQGRVAFVHSTIRLFMKLLATTTSRDLFEEGIDISQGPLSELAAYLPEDRANEDLKKVCDFILGDDIGREPYLHDYALRNILKHADRATTAAAQETFLAQLDIGIFGVILEQHDIPPEQASLFHLLAINDADRLVARAHNLGIPVEVDGVVSPLLTAIELNHIATAEALLNIGADVNQIHGGTTPVSWAVDSLGNEALEMCEMLLEHGASLDLDDEIPLTMALGQKSSIELVQLLVSKSDLHWTDHAGRTLLMLAIIANHFEAFKLLLPSAAVNATDHHGRTAFLIAAEYGRLEMLRYMADPMWAVHTGLADELGRTGLMLALLQGRSDSSLIRTLCEICNVNALDKNGRAVLRYGMILGVNTVRILLDAGANLEYVAQDETALMYACRQAAYIEAPLEMIIMLLARGSNPNDSDRDGKSCLMLACETGSVEIVQLLLDFWVDIAQIDHAGRTARDYAQGYPAHDIAQELLRRLDQGYTPRVREWSEHELDTSKWLPFEYKYNGRTFWGTSGIVEQVWLKLHTEILTCLVERGLAPLVSLECFIREADLCPLIAVYNGQSQDRWEVRALIKAICLPRAGYEDRFLVEGMHDDFTEVADKLADDRRKAIH